MIETIICAGEGVFRLFVSVRTSMRSNIITVIEYVLPGTAAQVDTFLLAQACMYYY